VVVLESGARDSEPATQGLNDGDVRGDAYADLRETRFRALGGTTGLWNTPVGDTVDAMGAKYAPLSPIDFEQRPSVEHSGWPITSGQLAAWYARAQEICGIGPFEYEGNAWGHCLPASGPAGPALVTRIYQFGGRSALIDPLVAALARAPNTRLCTRATLVRLEANASGRCVTGAVASTLGGSTWTVRAKHYVVAAGAIENARLLLLAADAGLRVASPWLGRGFMEHPRDSALTLIPRSRDFYRAAAFYDRHRAADGTMIVGRFAVCDAAIRDGALPNASATLLARVRPVVRRMRAAADRVGALARVDRWAPPGGHGWSRHPAPERVFDGFTILLNVEQTPSPENRIALGARRDGLGLPVPELHWRWHAADQARLTDLRDVVARELAELGRIEIATHAIPDPNAHHHAGTTRMHADSARGVVDADCRVHGTDNVFIAGASVFPTAGFVNPVLTIVALAARLADHLCVVSS
jgi:choline dehydrogenase-like flavoprotein